MTPIGFRCQLRTAKVLLRLQQSTAIPGYPPCNTPCLAHVMLWPAYEHQQGIHHCCPKTETYGMKIHTYMTETVVLQEETNTNLGSKEF
jgi:hypothetical protein